MELALFSKMKIIMQMLFSSFMSIELVLFFFLLFLVLVFNIKVQNKIMSFLFFLFFVISICSFVFCFSSYALTCVDSLIMKIMNYYYFPSTVIYFFLFLFMVVVCIYTMFARKLKVFKKIFNYCCSVVVFLLFSMFVVLVVQNGLDMADTVSLYQNMQILSIVQVSNLILLLWIFVTFFYYLYLFFIKKFDKEKVEII